MNCGAPLFLPGWCQKLRFNIANDVYMFCKEKRKNQKVFWRGKATACSNGARDFPSFFLSFYIDKSALCVSQHRQRDVIRRDWFWRRASLPGNESGYICCRAWKASSLIRLFHRSSVSFLISVRSWRFYCLIVPRPANVSSNRIDSRHFHHHLSYQNSSLNQNLFEQSCLHSTYVPKIKILSNDYTRICI